MSATTISIVNQKGGVGKTTTACALATGLAKKGYRTLIIDFDPQCNLSGTYNAAIDGVATIYDVLVNNIPITDAIQDTSMGYIVPGDPQLAYLDILMNDTLGKEYRLQERLTPVLDDYDVIVIDTPPALGLLPIMALTASQYAIVVANPNTYSIQGIAQLQDTIANVQKYTNHDLIVLGILINRIKARTTFSSAYLDVARETAAIIHTRLFDTTIRDAIALQESQEFNQSIFTYAPKSRVASDYMAFVTEVEEALKKRGEL